MQAGEPSTLVFEVTPDHPIFIATTKVFSSECPSYIFNLLPLLTIAKGIYNLNLECIHYLFWQLILLTKSLLVK
jgi:hypothetical protein